MILVIGGAYQGKLDMVKNKYGITDEEVFFCDESSRMDSSKKVIYGIEKYSLGCIREGINPEKEFEKAEYEDKILIATDVSCGIVPMDKTERAWREANGRMVTGLAVKADTVTRVFCGLSQNLKGE